MNSHTKINNTRIICLDIMRIAACCAVVMLHISADYVKELPIETFGFVCGNFLNSLTRFAVPVFFMISGALMLDEDKKTTTRKILKSTFSIFVLLMVWNVLYAVGYNIVKPIVFGEHISLYKIVDTIFNGHYHMWYLFVLIGLYLVTPILRTFVKRNNARLIGIYLIISIIVCFGGSFVNELWNLFVSEEDILLTYLSEFRLNYIYESLIFYILGWYLLNVEIKKKNRIFIYIGGVAGLVITFACTQLFYDNSKSVHNYFYSNDSLNVFLYSISIFTLLQHLFNGNTFRSNQFVLKLSNLTFGVYLVHPIFLFVFKKICEGIPYSLLEMLVIYLGAIVSSFVSMYILSKIPVLKKLIRG